MFLSKQGRENFLKALFGKTSGMGSSTNRNFYLRSTAIETDDGDQMYSSVVGNSLVPSETSLSTPMQMFRVVTLEDGYGIAVNGVYFYRITSATTANSIYYSSGSNLFYANFDAPVTIPQYSGWGIAPNDWVFRL